MPCLLPMAKQYISFDHIRKEGGCEDNETLYENYLSNFKLRESKKYGILYFVYKFNFGCFTPKKLDDKILFTLFEYATFNSFKTASEKGYNPDRIGVSFSYEKYKLLYEKYKMKVTNIYHSSKKSLSQSLE